MTEIAQLVRITPELLAELKDGWSRPIQLRVSSFKREGDVEEYELTMRAYQFPPMSAEMWADATLYLRSTPCS